MKLTHLGAGSGPLASAAVLLMTAGLLVSGGTATAADEGRRGDVDIFGSMGYTSSASGNLPNFPNVRFSIDHAWMWGGGGAYHFTDQLSVLMDLQVGYPNMRLTAATAGMPSITQTVDYFNGRMNLEFTPFTRLSPVLSAGIGFNNFQTVVPGASPQIYCTPGLVVAYWWCASGVPTFDTTAFSYNIGAGGRLDISNSIFLKLMYTSTWAELGSLGTRRFDQVTLQLGGRVRALE